MDTLCSGHLKCGLFATGGYVGQLFATGGILALCWGGITLS